MFGLGINIDLYNRPSGFRFFGARADATNYDVGDIAQWGGYAYQAIVGGLGNELFTGNLTTGDGISQSDTDATHKATFSASGMRVELSSYSPLTLINPGIVLVVGKRYRESFTITGTGEMQYGAHSGAVLKAGYTGEDFTSAGTNMLLYRKIPPVDQYYTSLSVKQVLLTGTGDPAFPGVGSTVVDGDITWKAIGAYNPPA